MKTLDKVIFEAPYSPTPWEANALHYLKEYRDYRNSNKTIIENGSVSKSLTLEEMKQMIGKPVFAYDLWYGLNIWHIIKDIDDQFIYFEDQSQWPIDELFCDEPSHLFFAIEQK